MKGNPGLISHSGIAYYTGLNSRRCRCFPSTQVFPNTTQKGATTTSQRKIAYL